MGSNRIIGQFPPGPIPITINNLDSGKTYYYRFKADNGTLPNGQKPEASLLCPTIRGICVFIPGWMIMDLVLVGSGTEDSVQGAKKRSQILPWFRHLYFAPDGSSWTLTKAIFSFDESLHWIKLK